VEVKIVKESYKTEEEEDTRGIRQNVPKKILKVIAPTAFSSSDTVALPSSGEIETSGSCMANHKELRMLCKLHMKKRSKNRMCRLSKRLLTSLLTPGPRSMTIAYTTE
jgi:hypothetical protein